MDRMKRPVLRSGYVRTPEDLEEFMDAIKPPNLPFVEVAAMFFEEVGTAKKDLIRNYLQGCLDKRFTPWVVVRA